MATDERFRLCGGTFLTLLLQARKQRTAARKNSSGERDGLSDGEVFAGLLRVVQPNFETPAGRSFVTYTSSYKACRLSSNEYLPFDKSSIIEKFNSALLDNYSSVLKRMCEFTSCYLDEQNKGEWLICAILEIISKDDEINDEPFYIDRYGKRYSKEKIMEADSVEFQPFLLGVWNFIVNYRFDNSVGADTYERWHQKGTTRSRPKFISQIGMNWRRDIEVVYLSLNAIDEEEEEQDPYVVPSNKEALLLPGGIAPELTGEAPWILIPKGILPAVTDFSEYLDNAYDKYSHVKTLLYSDAPRDFYDFYVCNDISQKIYTKKSSYKIKRIKDVSVKKLKDCSNFILISGTGGLGKSMMMRHLLLDAADNFDDLNKVPIFIPLKDYDSTYRGIVEYIYEKYESLGGKGNMKEFSELLEVGKCLLLFDGLDEIRSDFRKTFELQLDLFADKYTDNMFIISSRPTGPFVSLNRFTVLELCPFSKEQALMLIDKLDFRPDEPTIKKRFREELEFSLYYTHMEFTQNPLLLTIMLMTYEQFAEIPSKMHIFYREAYVALSQKHDASKGAYKRVLKTGLTADRFAEYFAEFCARSYRDERFEFTEVQFEKYFNELRERQKGLEEVTASDFRDDLVGNMCLMFYESGKYHFTHRSFQEYFCALYFSKQKDRTLGHIGDFFENKKSRHYTDKTFNMLYDMIPEKIEEYIFEPFLTSLFRECDEQEGYWTFLQRMYPVLYYEDGETSGYSINEPDSFLYDFIAHNVLACHTFGNEDLPQDERFVVNEWVYLDEAFEDPDYDTNELIELKEVPWEYKREYGDPEIVGTNYEIQISNLLNDPESFDDVVSLLENDEFPLKAEFVKVREYMQKLIDEKETVGDDLFDMFL